MEVKIKAKIFDIKILSFREIKFEGKILKRKKYSCRSIFFTDKYVIKLDNNYDCRDNQCHAEYRNWNKIKSSKYVCYFNPILQKGSVGNIDYVIQPRIKLARGRRPLWAIELVEEIEKYFKLFDLTNNYNWTMVDGNVVIFDYAW